MSCTESSAGELALCVERHAVAQMEMMLPVRHHHLTQEAASFGSRLRSQFVSEPALQ